jgi:RNA polymerase sigma-70 factor (ECF subfamily)
MRDPILPHPAFNHGEERLTPFFRSVRSKEMGPAYSAAFPCRLPLLRARAYCQPVTARDEPASDEELMLAYGEGNADAFDALYRRHKAPLYRFLVRQCRDAGVAEELFQDVWMNVIRARSGYRASARFATYLYHIAHNRLIDHYRRRSPAALVSFDEDEGALELPGPRGAEPAVAYDARAQAARLLELLKALPEAQREAFVLQHEAGMSIEEIAEATGVTGETAKSRLRYAMKKLREGMSEWL